MPSWGGGTLNWPLCSNSPHLVWTRLVVCLPQAILKSGPPWRAGCRRAWSLLPPGASTLLPPLRVEDSPFPNSHPPNSLPPARLRISLGTRRLPPPEEQVEEAFVLFFDFSLVNPHRKREPRQEFISLLKTQLIVYEKLYSYLYVRYVKKQKQNPTEYI